METAAISPGRLPRRFLLTNNNADMGYETRGNTEGKNAVSAGPQDSPEGESAYQNAMAYPAAALRPEALRRSAGVRRGAAA